MRAYLYCRIAAQPQQDSEYMAAQENELRQFAERKHLRVVGTTCEYAIGTILNRPGLKDMANAVCAGQVDVVVVYSLSRISRESDMIAEYIRFLHLYGASLLSLKEGMMLPAVVMFQDQLYSLMQKSECPYRSFQIL